MIKNGEIWIIGIDKLILIFGKMLEKDYMIF